MPPLAAIDTLTPYLVLTLVGFAVGVFGHLARSKPTIALGIALIMIASVAFFAVSLEDDSGPPPSGEGIPENLP